MSRVPAVLLFVLFALHAATAQQPSSGFVDTLRLGALREAALRQDPRAAQIALQRARTALRLRDLDVERLPAFTGEAQAQYQSDVTSIPIRLPTGTGVPTPPHDTYDARVVVQERLLDPSLAPRRAVERAQLAQTEAQTRTALEALRGQTDEAFFAAALLQSRAGELAAAITDLEAQLALVRARVREGSALPGDTATIVAALLRRGEDARALRADRAAALTVLADLAGRPIAPDDVLALPDLAAAVARARAAADSGRAPRARPEYVQLARTRDLLAAQEDVVAAQTRPRLSAFARLGYGRPGLDMLSRSFEGYWLAGVQVQWAPWTWGAVDRQRESLALQRRVVGTEEDALTASLRRAVARDLATIDRLEGAAATDERIITLREQVLRETRARFGEGMVTAAELVDRQTDLLTARLDRATHLVELAQARAHYLMTLGVEIP